MRKDKAFADEVVGELKRNGVQDEKILKLLHDCATTGTRRVEKLAQRAGVARRTLQREFDRTKLGSPNEWIQLIGILRVMRQLEKAPDGSIRAAAIACGYPDPFTFSNQMHRLLNIRPAAAREAKLTLSQLVDRWFTLREGQVAS